MPLFAIPFPAIDPVAISLGPLAIRWYALAYTVGLLIGWRYCLALAGRPPHLAGRQDVDDFLVWATLGVVLGGRLGYVLFYMPGYYAAHPLEALYVWHGGMSFHGGALGVTIAILLFTRARKIPLFAFSDIITEAIPIGLFFGRIANPLSPRIARRIGAGGPLTIAAFMAMALHDSKEGYYARRSSIGAHGDFVTATEISQVFGELIGLWCALMWQRLGAPDPIILA